MEKRIINLSSSEKVMKMEYSFMYTVSHRIARETGIRNTDYVTREVLNYLKEKDWVSEDLQEFGLEQLEQKNYPKLVDETNSLINVFVNMLSDKIPSCI